MKMYNVFFYEDKDGTSPIYDYIKQLATKSDKDSRINHNKINDYIQILSKYGTKAGEPYVKHIDGAVYELRPIKNRIFFASWQNESFILLHYFHKKTRKTPKKEIDQAKRNLNDMIKRSE